MAHISVVENCILQCPTECNYVRFDVLEKNTFPIDLDEMCKTVGMEIHDHSLGVQLTEEKLKSGYYPLIYKYKKVNESQVLNFTKSWNYIEALCQNIMKNDIAIVKVSLASSRYTKTLVDRRLTFEDKLSSFGTISIL